MIVAAAQGGEMLALGAALVLSATSADTTADLTSVCPRGVAPAAANTGYQL